MSAIEVHDLRSLRAAWATLRAEILAEHGIPDGTRVRLAPGHFILDTRINGVWLKLTTDRADMEWHLTHGTGTYRLRRRGTA